MQVLGYNLMITGSLLGFLFRISPLLLPPFCLGTYSAFAAEVPRVEICELFPCSEIM